MRWRLLVPILVAALGVSVWNAPDDPRDASAPPPYADVQRAPQLEQDRPPAASAAELAWGETFFVQAVEWLQAGAPPVDRVRALHLRCDARCDFYDSAQEGTLRAWYRAPDAFRQEIRTRGGTLTNILTGQGVWFIDAQGHAEDLRRRADGVRVARWIRQDRDRLVDVGTILALRPLLGDGARFRFDGYKRGSGTYAGNWIKVTRLAPDKRRFIFWFAYERVNDRAVRVTWPGIVRIEDEGERGLWTEDWILREWESPLRERGTGRRFPRRIEAYTIEKDEVGRTTPSRFLFAVVEDLEINESVEEDLFAPPK